MPGMVDLHVHLPQLPNAGVGAGLDLLTWLERYIFPLERAFDEAAAERLAPLAFRAFAAAGTTTAVLYGAVFEPSLDAAFRAAEAHGIRAVIGKVMMDRGSYDDTLSSARVLDASLRQSADLCARWHMRDDGRLRYAFTPRFAISCGPDMLRKSAALAAGERRVLADAPRGGPQRDPRGRPALSRRRRLPRRLRPGGRPRAADDPRARHPPLDREIARLAETDAAIAHCPASNLFLASGAMPLARYLAAGIRVGLGSDVAAGPELSIFANMRAGAYIQSGLRVLADERGEAGDDVAPLQPLDWLRLATLDGARALGQQDSIGSLEAGKEADLIAVDPRLGGARAGDRLRRPGRGHVAAGVPPAPGHGPRRLGPRPAPGRAARVTLTADLLIEGGTIVDGTGAPGSTGSRGGDRGTGCAIPPGDVLDVVAAPDASTRPGTSSHPASSTSTATAAS